MTPEAQSRVAILRAKAAENRLTPEEMKEVVSLLREGRLAAANSSEQAKRKAAKKAIPTADDLFAELDSI